MTAPAPIVVLIAEDEVLVSRFLAELVEDAGMAVGGIARTAEDARAAAAARPPELALVDVNLKGGGGSGIDLAAALMADHGTAVVFITGESGVADWPEVAALKPAAVLEKPFLPDELVAALQHAASTRIPGVRAAG